MQIVKELNIFDIFRLKPSKLELCIENSPYLAFASKMFWLYLKVTQSIGIENNYRKKCKQSLIHFDFKDFSSRRQYFLIEIILGPLGPIVLKIDFFCTPCNYALLWHCWIIHKCYHSIFSEKAEVYFCQKYRSSRKQNIRSDYWNSASRKKKSYIIHCSIMLKGISH